MDRRSQEGEGEAQETLPAVSLLAVINRDSRGAVAAEGKEESLSEDQGEHGGFARLGGYASYWELHSVVIVTLGAGSTAA